MKRRIESTTSRTAELTCLSRAASTMEKNPCYHSDDFIAPLLLPGGFKTFMRVPLSRRLFMKLFAPQGIYEYVIARTKYIDAVFKQALSERFDQGLIFGAGFDTRAIRFHELNKTTQIYELDISTTQQAKIGQYQKRGVTAPPELHYIPIDFDKESLPEKLDEAGFEKGKRSLFLMEGLLMYLQPASVMQTFQTIRNYAGRGSLIVFDYVKASVIHSKGGNFGETEIVKMVSGAGESWFFGIEKGKIEQFLAGYSMRLVDHKDAEKLEETYFTGSTGKLIAPINGTHCLVTAEKN
ncbi:MAG: SAM-dependent methyltransferase [Chloroflexi bacterium]|nr:SAM-dependent methyltransferase [Chloroflexota bacterium]